MMKRRSAALRSLLSIVVAACLIGLIGTPPPARAEQHVTPAFIYIEDDFSQRGIWPTRTDENFRIEYTREGLRLYNNFFSSYISTVRGYPSDIFIEVEAVRTDGPAGSYYGVACRWQDIHNYYALAAFGDNRMTIARVLDGEVEFLDTVQATQEQFDTRSENRIGGICEGSTLTLMINGEAILQVEDTTFASGAAGVMAGTIGTPGLDVTFRNIFIGSARLREVQSPGVIPITGAGERIYTVQRGDTLSEIAFEQRTTLSAVLELNPEITNPRRIYPGQQIVIPGPDAPRPTPTPAAPTPTQPGAADRPPVFHVPEPRAGERLYTVQTGDTLLEIAARFNASLNYLLERNPHIINPNLILPGQRLIVPTAQPQSSLPGTAPLHAAGGV
jgi:LysM repeat protein